MPVVLALGSVGKARAPFSLEPHWAIRCKTFYTIRNMNVFATCSTLEPARVQNELLAIGLARRHQATVRLLIQRSDGTIETIYGSRPGSRNPRAKSGSRLSRSKSVPKRLPLSTMSSTE